MSIPNNYGSVQLPPFKEDFPKRGGMAIYNNPSKKIRLDLSNNYDGSFANDDLWGAEDITAEEFDMLEVQATQSHMRDDSASATFIRPFANKNDVDQTALLQAEEMKQQQYELEGKIKLLSDSLEKVTKELKDEKINRDRIANQKVLEFQEKENGLRKEIQKVESVLQFKNQEMKTVYGKIHVLEAQLKEKKEIFQPASNASATNFVEKFQFKTDVSLQTAVMDNAENKSKIPHRKHKLLVDTPRGKTQGTDIVSSILCNRLAIPALQNSYFSPLLSTSPEVSGKNPPQLSAVSIARLESDQEAEELFDHCTSVLRNHLSHLKSSSGKNVSAGSSANSPLSLRRKELNNEQSTVISCLKDLTFIFSCTEFTSSVQLSGNENSNWMEVAQSENQPSCSGSVRSSKKSDDTSERFHPLLKLLVCLSNPDNYPSGYSKTEEIELSLSALAAWASAAPENLLHFADEIPFASLIGSYHTITSLQISIMILLSLCFYKVFIPLLVHKNDIEMSNKSNLPQLDRKIKRKKDGGDGRGHRSCIIKDSCILCAISSIMLQKVSASPLEFISVLSVILGFFSSLFTVHNFSELMLENSPCSSVILQGVIATLWNVYDAQKETNHDVILVLRKGFTLLHFLSRFLPNFKGKRIGFEDNYVSLVGAMLTLSKENPLFKDYYDLIHDLWDFQEDVSELDLDESPEDSTQAMDLLN